MSTLRQGDIAIYQTPDGGNILIINGEPVMDGGFESTAYLSLFGGGENTHWSEEYQGESEKLTSRFYNFITTQPKSVTNINRAEELATQDLSWFLKEGIADTLNLSITSTDKSRIQLTYELLLDGTTLAKNLFNINWGYEESLPAHGRI